jgi:ABC-2 type transport system permease protein
VEAPDLAKTILEMSELPVVAENAPPPYFVTHTSFRTFFRQYRVMFLTMLASYRGNWFFYIFAGAFLPVSLVFFAKSILGSANTQQAIYLLGGNMAMSIAFGPALFLISQIGWQKQNKDFQYWVTLPIPKMLLFVAIITVSVLFALPGLLGTYIAGCLMLGLPFTGGLLLVVLIPLSALSLTGLGALLGSISPNGMTSNMIGNLFLTVVGFLSPMLIPLQNLPGLLQFTSRFIPTTYIADAFRISLGWQGSSSLLLDIVVLVVTTVVFMGIAQWRIDWRSA